MHSAPSTLAFGAIIIGVTQAVPDPSEPEPIEVVELPLPPVAPSNDTVACTAAINPHRTGCIGQALGEFQAGSFTPDWNHVVVNVEFVGAPTAPDPASIYTSEQLILVKADGTNFTNGDPWKCLSCGVPAANAVSLAPERDYPYAFRSGDKALWGRNILDCDGDPLSSDAYTPNTTHIYPTHWNTAVNGSGSGGTPRELRLHPDDVHMGWSSFTDNGGQFAYFGRLEFNPEPSVGEPLAPRYDLVDVNLLVDPNDKAFVTSNGTELQLSEDSITVGELRGFSGTGDEITYTGSSHESNNIDLFAVHVVTGAVRRLTSHPEYADPMAFSADNEWFVAMDTRGTDRQMWMSGMRGIPLLIDIVTVTVAAPTRNNGPRRFFQPILIDRYGDRGEYFEQTPAFSPDGTRIVFWQSLVVSPSCGGTNPLPCPVSTAQGGRTYRLMVARLTSREPKDSPPAFDIPDEIPWATPFPPGTSIPERYSLEPGNSTLHGKLSGVAEVTLAESSGASVQRTVSVTYTNYSDSEEHILNGQEEVTLEIPPSNPWLNRVDWYSDLVQTGVVEGTKETSPGGFHLEIDAQLNEFITNGTLTTTLDGVVYEQPPNGT